MVVDMFYFYFWDLSVRRLFSIRCFFVCLFVCLFSKKKRKFVSPGFYESYCLI